jgi:hypothetical protein
MVYLEIVINPSITIVLQSIEDIMLLCMNYHIHLPDESFLFAIVKGAIQIDLSGTGHVPHIDGTKEMAKKDHESVPFIPGAYDMLDVNKT